MNAKTKIGFLILSIVLPQAVYPDQITDTYNTGDTLTADMLDNIKSAVNGNDANISNNAAGIANNFDAIDQRLLPLEARANGQTVNVDCASDSAALKNLTLVR